MQLRKRKYSKTKLPWFSRFIQPSARKQGGGLVLQHTRAHTRQTLNQIKTTEYTAEHGEAESEFLQWWRGRWRALQWQIRRRQELVSVLRREPTLLTLQTDSQ